MKGKLLVPEISLSLYTWLVILLCLCVFVYIVVNWLTDFNVNTRWWREGVIYHVYPRSFNDSSGDGNGDIRGIINKLDYFEELGVNVIYLSPIFESPMADNGYDISDFNQINPLFGNMDDFDDLLDAVHEQNIKLVLDFVPNHTSNQHPWFLESSKDKQNPKRDWYVWRDPSADGGPPNNWVSVFGGSAWTFDSKTKQYYLHQFYKEQPDLNFREPAVVEAMKDVLRFWLDKGVDGFRVDAVPHLFEDEMFRDEPTLPNYNPKKPKHKDLTHVYTYDLDEVHPIVQGWRKVCDQYKDSYRLLFGEITSGRTTMYYGTKKAPEFDFPMNFTFIGLDDTCTAADIHKKITEYLNSLPKGAWPNWLLGNHDSTRIASRVGKDFIGACQVLLLSLPGTPIMYYGDEVGMLDAMIDKKSLQDHRDPCRTPLPWNTAKNSGFSPGTKTWLPIDTNFEENNVELNQFDSTSVLTLCQKMLQLRKTARAFKGLGFEVVHVDESVLAYKRFHRWSAYLVVLNFGESSWAGSLDNISGLGRVFLDSTTIKPEGTRVNVKQLLLHKGQALVIKMD